MEMRTVLLLCCVIALTGCTGTSFGGEKERHESFRLQSKPAVDSVRVLEFEVRLKGNLQVDATSEPGPVLVVLQKKANCGSFADDHAIPGSRYEKTNISFEYYVDSPGDYCLSLQNRSGGPINVTVTVKFP